MYPNYSCKPNCYNCCNPQNSQNCCIPCRNSCPPCQNDCCMPTQACCHVDRYCCEPRVKSTPMAGSFLGVRSSTPIKRRTGSTTKKQIKTTKLGADKKRKSSDGKGKKSLTNDSECPLEVQTPEVDTSECDCCPCKDSSLQCMEEEKCCNEISLNNCRRSCSVTSVRKTGNSTDEYKNSVQSVQSSTEPKHYSIENVEGRKKASFSADTMNAPQSVRSSCTESKRFSNQNVDSRRSLTADSAQSVRSSCTESKRFSNENAESRRSLAADSAQSVRSSSTESKRFSNENAESRRSLAADSAQSVRSSNTEPKRFSYENADSRRSLNADSAQSIQSYASIRNSYQKQQKNKKNYEYQDRNMRTPMEVIAEEEEEGDSSLDGGSSKSIQDTCADFLNIVNDSVLDTVQKSVECMLQQYFCRTMDRIENLCSHVMRNDCLISKMYIDLMDKICQHNEKSQLQFKCLCEFLIESKKESTQSSYAKCFDTLNKDFNKCCGLEDMTPDTEHGSGGNRPCTCCECTRNSIKQPSISRKSGESLHPASPARSMSREKGGRNGVYKTDASSMTENSYISSFSKYPSLIRRYDLTPLTKAKLKPNQSENSFLERNVMSNDLLHKPHSDLQIHFAVSKAFKPRVNLSDSSLSNIQ